MDWPGWALGLSDNRDGELQPTEREYVAVAYDGGRASADLFGAHVGSVGGPQIVDEEVGWRGAQQGVQA